MRPEEAIIILVSKAEEIAPFGLKSISLFGSVARDEARPDSDIDIIVEFENPPTFDRYIDLKFYLEGILKRKVDLVDWDMLRPEIRHNIEKDLIPIV